MKIHQLHPIYDPQSTLCYDFESTFLLDNTQLPSLQRHVEKKVFKDFLAFENELFSINQSFDNLDDSYHYAYYDRYFYYPENYNYHYALHNTEGITIMTLKDHFGNLSIPNKYFLLETLGFKDGRIKHWKEQGWATGRVSRPGDFETPFLPDSEWLRVNPVIFDLGPGFFRE